MRLSTPSRAYTRRVDGIASPLRHHGGTGFGYSEYLIKRGYIQALVDVRGTGGSGGQWEFNEPIEAQDSKTVIDWADGLGLNRAAVVSAPGQLV